MDVNNLFKEIELDAMIENLVQQALKNTIEFDGEEKKNTTFALPVSTVQQIDRYSKGLKITKSAFLGYAVQMMVEKVDKYEYSGKKFIDVIEEESK